MHQYSGRRLALFLANHLPGGLNWSFFVNSGSEAVETAMKMAVQYWQEKGQYQKSVFLSRWGSYHGITLGALSLSGFYERRYASPSCSNGFLPFQRLICIVQSCRERNL
ncbi:aminotransferase class III-fold pyridoxal phosphate-dependent enzyme [Bacillus velezensis]|nr:aminotransferase class III-fold pyridoxal phosphate-dependent enzyme [Bacillus velezensis]